MVSTVGDFKKYADDQRTQAAKEITLPSGLVVLAYQPSADWWIRHLGQLPVGAMARMMGADEATQARNVGVEDLIKYANWSVAVIQEVVVSPVIKLNPAPDELDPNLISDKDRHFLIRYAGGEVSADGASLDAFPSK